MQLSIANLVECTAAEGPGLRFAIWFQGCPLRCAKCCNPEMIPFKGGDAWSVASLVKKVADARAQGIEGITLLGGEPFAHARGASELSVAVRQLGLSVMIFSGYTLDQLRKAKRADYESLLAATDILVDGPFESDKPDDERRWIGSTNQQIHFLSDRYDASDSRWRESDTLEIRMHNGQLSVNGFPAAGVSELWKRPKAPRQKSGT